MTDQPRPAAPAPPPPIPPAYTATFAKPNGFMVPLGKGAYVDAREIVAIYPDAATDMRSTLSGGNKDYSVPPSSTGTHPPRLCIVTRTGLALPSWRGLGDLLNAVTMLQFLALGRDIPGPPPYPPDTDTTQEQP